jgi:hypothetical protein
MREILLRAMQLRRDKFLRCGRRPMAGGAEAGLSSLVFFIVNLYPVCGD